MHEVETSPDRFETLKLLAEQTSVASATDAQERMLGLSLEGDQRPEPTVLRALIVE